MYLGIDLGTSEVKVLLLASDGSVVGTAGTPFTVSRPKPRWSEQNPLDWWEGTRAALFKLREKFPDEFAQDVARRRHNRPRMRIAEQAFDAQML